MPQTVGNPVCMILPRVVPVTAHPFRAANHLGTRVLFAPDGREEHTRRQVFSIRDPRPSDDAVGLAAATNDTRYGHAARGNGETPIGSAAFVHATLSVIVYPEAATVVPAVHFAVAAVLRDHADSGPARCPDRRSGREITAGSSAQDRTTRCADQCAADGGALIPSRS